MKATSKAYLVGGGIGSLAAAAFLVPGRPTQWTAPYFIFAMIWEVLPAATRAEIQARNLRLLALDTASLAMKYAPRPDLEIRMQGVALVGVFLKVSPFAERAGLDGRPAHVQRALIDRQPHRAAAGIRLRRCH